METTRRDLTYFVVLAQEKHLRNAAHRLGIGASTMSGAIKRLEGSCRLQLFDRSARPIQLTPDGVFLLPLAEKAIQAAHRFDAKVADLTIERSPVVRVGTLLGYGSQWLLAAAEELEVEAGISLELHAADFADISAGLRSQSADVAILAGPSDLDHALDEHVIGYEERVAVCANDHHLTTLESVSVADLDRAGWLDVEASDQRWYRYWQAADARNDQPPPTLRRLCRNGNELTVALAAGDGVCTTLLGLAEQFVMAGVAFVHVEDLAPCPIRLAWRADAPPPRGGDLAQAVTAAAGPDLNSPTWLNR